MMIRILLIIYVCMLLSGAHSVWAQPAGGSKVDTDKIYRAVQQATFQYFWEGAEPVSGLARERIHLDGQYPQNDADVVTSGGGGFGVMAIIAGVEQKFITKRQALDRFERILTFLETADRYHGVWPHWWYGPTGKVKPFSKKDDGGDLVETSFMAQGLICLREYLKGGSKRERAIAQRADKLWRDIDFNYYRNGSNVLYWHWSPNYGWEMNHSIRGYNECLITYFLAVASPTHGVPVEVYHEGWAGKGAIKNDTSVYGYPLSLWHHGAPYGGPLFWAHYSYLGLDPRGLKDKYADYWQENVSHASINHLWCAKNPLGYQGYSDSSWGLTSSYSVKGYAGHAPGEKRDRGVIAPTAALASMPYTPQQSTAALVHWYTTLHDKLMGKYGFYDAFSVTENWYPQRYLAIDQGPIVVMMENHKTQLLWKLFMQAPEVKEALVKLGFESPWLK